MRIVSFIAYLSFLLLSGKSYAAISHTQVVNFLNCEQQFIQKHHVKLAEDTNTITLIEDIGVNLEEEIHSEKSTKAHNRIEFYKGRYSLINTLFSIHPSVSITNYYIKVHETFAKSNFGSCPIYLANSVLLI
jgi:hypothetical protein